MHGFRTVQELLGHKGIAMTLRYSHLAPGHMQEAVDKLVPPEKRTDTKTDTGSNQEGQTKRELVN